jgi:hypothetical protein
MNVKCDGMMRCVAGRGKPQPNAASKQRQEGGTSLLQSRAAALPRRPPSIHLLSTTKFTAPPILTFKCTEPKGKEEHLEAQNSIPMGDFG